MMVKIACETLEPHFECTYRRGLWAVTPFMGGDGNPVEGLYVVTHIPTGRKPPHPPLKHDGALNFCRALADEFPDFMADASYRQQSPSGLRAMAKRVAELYNAAERTVGIGPEHAR